MKQEQILYRLFSSIYFCSLFFNSFSQVPDFQFAKRAGGISNQDFAVDVVYDIMGDIIITGRMGDSADFDGNLFTPVGTGDQGPQDMYVAKYDPNGNLIWLHHTGGTDQPGQTTANSGNAVIVDPSNNIIAAGVYGGSPTVFGADTLPIVGVIQDGYLVKYDENGNILWAKAITGADGVVCEGLANDAQGNIYVTGTFGHHNFSGSINFDGTILNSVGGRDIFLAKYDPSGALLWAKRAGAPNLNNSDVGVEVGLDASGNIFISGYVGEGLVDFGNGVTFNSLSDRDIYVAKYDPNGNAIWANRAGGIDRDFGFDMVADQAGNSYLTGSFAATVAFDAINLTSQGDQDIFVAKYDPNGILSWVRQSGGVGDDWGLGINLDDQDNPIISGYFEQTATFGSTSLISAGDTDIFYLKYDHAGNQEWVLQAGGTGRDWGYNLSREINGNIYAVGHFENTGSFGSLSLTSTAARDIFFLKLAPSIIPLVVDAGIDHGICLGDSVQLGGNPSAIEGLPPYSYSWSPTTGLDDPNSPNPISSIGASILYTLTVTDANNHMQSDSVLVSIYPAFTVDLGPDTHVYPAYPDSSCVNLQASIEGNTGPYTYLWSTGDTTASIHVCPTRRETYSLVVTDVNSCTSEDEITVCPIRIRCRRHHGHRRRIRICHRNGYRYRNLCVPIHAVAAYLANGAKLGQCGQNQSCNPQHGHKEMLSIKDDSWKLQIYPNPFTESSILSFQAPRSTQLEIQMLDLQGRVVKQVLKEKVEEGDDRTFKVDASDLSEGIYTMVLISEKEVIYEKVLIQR